MNPKTISVALAMLLSVTSATLAQGYGSRQGYGHGDRDQGYRARSNGLYNFAPGYGYGGRYSRGGSGTRFGAGSDGGIESER